LLQDDISSGLRARAAHVHSFENSSRKEPNPLAGSQRFWFYSPEALIRRVRYNGTQDASQEKDDQSSKETAIRCEAKTNNGHCHRVLRTLSKRGGEVSAGRCAMVEAIPSRLRPVEELVRQGAG
jgi:hypothetical protein